MAKASYSFKLEGGAKLRKQLAKLDPKTNHLIFTNSVREVATKIIANAKNVQMRRGGGAVHPTKLTHRHPGAGLGSSIGPDFRGLPRYAEVGTEKGYGAIHEFGLGRYPARPFMAPALEAVKPEIPGIVIRNWKRAGGL